MRRKETMGEQIERERRENFIHSKLMDKPDPYPNVTRTRVIKLGQYNTLFSLHWILLYAHARHSGIACVFTSGEYASRKMGQCPIKWFNYSEAGIDEQLLWRAHQYHVSQHKALQRRIKREQKKKQLELVLA